MKINEFNTSILCATTLLILTLGADMAISAKKPEFVLVHGASHGAWCWYKVRAILEHSGFKTTAIDMASNGRDQTEANSVMTVERYVKPLTDFLARLNVSEKVILVGHSLGGVSISFAMEKYPEKVSKAIYVSALLPGNNESALETFLPGVVETMIKEQKLLVQHGNGPNAAPTSFLINPNFQSATKYLCNESPAEDVYLATTMLNWTPFVALAEKLNLSPERYGRIPRYYIVTGKDFMLDELTYQQSRIIILSMTKSFNLERSDHSPFFSMPSELSSLLFTIASL